MPLQLFIGQPKLNGAIGKYASRYNLLELRADQEHLPRENVLRRWAEEVPENFVFSILLAPQHLRVESESSSGLDRILAAADALKAKWIVTQTDPMWGPSQKTKQRLATVLKKLLDSGRHIGWEPHGVWQDDEAFAFARELGVNYVRDIGRGDPMNEDVVYSRMPSLGVAARMSMGTMERVARNLGNATQAYIVVAGEGGRKLQQLLPDLVLAQQQGLGAHSTVETFGGFSAGSSDAEEFDELDEASESELDESDTEIEEGDEGAEYDSELDEEGDEGAEYDSELDEEDDEDDESEDEDEQLTETDDTKQPASKWAKDQKKKTRGRNRR